MILKSIILLTSNLTKNILIFSGLMLSLYTFAKDIPKHTLKDIKCDINSNNNTYDDNIDLAVSPTIDFEGGFIFDSSNSSVSSATEFVFFEDEESQIDDIVFEDEHPELQQQLMDDPEETESDEESGYESNDLGFSEAIN